MKRISQLGEGLQDSQAGLAVYGISYQDTLIN